MSQAQLFPAVSPSSSLPPITYKGLPVVTTEMLAKAYGCDTTSIKTNFNRNRERFVEGKHFFMLTNGDLRKFRDCVTDCNAQIPARTRNLTLWLERGAARHAKMLNTDQAWDVFEMLEETFFRVVKPAKQPAAPKKKALGRGIKALPEGKPSHVFKRMGLTPIEELQMGPHIKRMFEGLDMDKIGPLTMEALILKAKYASAISEVYRLNRSLLQDMDRLMHDVNGPAMKTLNKTGCFSDPVADTLYEPRYRLDRVNEDYRAAALAALNSNICMAMMLGV